MLGILWKDLKVMRMQTAILTSVFLMMTVASVWNTGRQDDISFFLNFLRQHRIISTYKQNHPAKC